MPMDWLVCLLGFCTDIWCDLIQAWSCSVFWWCLVPLKFWCGLLMVWAFCCIAPVILQGLLPVGQVRNHLTRESLSWNENHWKTPKHQRNLQNPGLESFWDWPWLVEFEEFPNVTVDLRASSPNVLPGPLNESLNLLPAQPWETGRLLRWAYLGKMLSAIKGSTKDYCKKHQTCWICPYHPHFLHQLSNMSGWKESFSKEYDAKRIPLAEHCAQTPFSSLTLSQYR